MEINTGDIVYICEDNYNCVKGLIDTPLLVCFKDHGYYAVLIKTTYNKDDLLYFNIDDVYKI